MISIKNQLITLYQRITEIEKIYQRNPNSVSLLIASKGQSLDKIKEAWEAGQSCFGENYLQEALPKIAALPNIEWHFIGPIQSNKTRKIAENFTWVQSVDSLKIAKRLNEQRPSHLSPLNICIEVNISEEATKSGVMVDEVEILAKNCLDLPRLRLRGLMTIPAKRIQFDEQREAYRKLSDLWHHLRQLGFSFDTLSMGMSQDMEAAIAEGSTLVRIGTAFWHPSSP